MQSAYKKMREIVFQFHRGSINILALQLNRLESRSFNSIEVRLILLEFQNVDGSISEFQFHRGSINIQIRVLPSPHVPCFNSIEVRLISVIAIFPYRKNNRFNSIEVRLISYGAKTMASFMKSFNSIEVRLICLTCIGARNKRGVSIP